MILVFFFLFYLSVLYKIMPHLEFLLLLKCFHGGNLMAGKTDDGSGRAFPEE